MATHSENTQKKPTCGDCSEWRGRCGLGKHNRLASDAACTDYAGKMGDWLI